MDHKDIYITFDTDTDSYHIYGRDRHVELPKPVPDTPVPEEKHHHFERFASGAVRDSASDKPRPDLISPLAMARLGEWLRLGAVKYGERNWEAGIPAARTFQSLYRHLLRYQEGDRSEDHLAAIFCNAMFLLHAEEMVRRGLLPAELLDMPTYVADGHAAPPVRVDFQQNSAFSKNQGTTLQIPHS